MGRGRVKVSYPRFDGHLKRRHNPEARCVTRHRKRFTREFKREAVRCLKKEG